MPRAYRPESTYFAMYWQGSERMARLLREKALTPGGMALLLDLCRRVRWGEGVVVGTTRQLSEELGLSGHTYNGKLRQLRRLGLVKLLDDRKAHRHGVVVSPEVATFGRNRGRHWEVWNATEDRLFPG